MSWDSFHAIEAINIIDVDKVASVGPLNEAVNYIGNEIEKRFCVYSTQTRHEHKPLPTAQHIRNSAETREEKKSNKASTKQGNPQI